MRPGTRILASIGVIGVAGGLAGLTTWSSFTDSASSPHAITTGAVEIDLGAPGTSANRLDVDASDLAPGDTAQRAVDLINRGTLDLGSITTTITASPSSALDTDEDHGLRVAIDRCSVPWTESGTAPAYTYSCSGSVTQSLAIRPVITTATPLTVPLGSGTTSHLRVTISLPSTADNRFQGLSSGLHFSFQGVQRAATDR